MITYTLKVIDIIKETNDTVTLCFKQPALRKIKYEAGQYLTLIFRINGRRYLRPYSFSSAPSKESTLQVTIKRVPNGIVSNHIHDRISIGDAVEVLQPIGDFVFKYRPIINSVYFWTAGSGITPIISLIKEILSTDSSIKLNLIYGNRSFDTTIFANTINDLLRSHPHQFKVWHFHTKLTINQSDLTIIEGRISKQYILDICMETSATNSLHYICGPAGLKTSVKEALETLNILKENVFSEDFESVKDPKDFVNISTQNVKFKFQDADHLLEVVKGKSILEAALDAGYELPYSCQTGNCTICKAKLITGEIKMIGISNEKLDYNANEYLLCCAYPSTENVYLEVINI